MRSKKLNTTSTKGYREVLEALELDGKCIKDLTIKTVERIDQLLDDAFNQTNLDRIRTLAYDSVINVPISMDNRSNDEDISQKKSHLVIRCNERLEMLVERVKQTAFLFTENAEKIRGLIDLNVMYKNGIDYETQSVWKNELVQMQGQISSYQMNISTYYRNRSDIGINIIKQPCINDYWIQLIENDQDLFFQLRTMLMHLRLFYRQLYQIVSHWIHLFDMIK